MAISITLTGNYTLDESPDEQNGVDGTPSATPRADSDVDVSTLPATFSTFLFTTLGLSNAYPTAIGVGASPADLINVVSDGTLSSLALTDSAGDPFDGDDSGLLTADGDAVFLWSALDNQVVLGKTAGGTVVFAVYMQPDGALDADVDVKLWSVTFEAMEHNVDGGTAAAYDDALDLLGLVNITAIGSKTFDFDDLPSGQNLFGIVGDTQDAIVIVGELPVLKANGEFSNTSDTINTSKGG